LDFTPFKLAALSLNKQQIHF